MARVVLYSKPGCHLCESAEQVLSTVARRVMVDFTVRDIRDDSAEFARYEQFIPVVLLDGVEIARFRLASETLEAALSAAGLRGGDRAPAPRPTLC